jgi:hypothetical protein
MYSSKTELFKEKAIQIPRMDEPFFSKVHEVYFKATPAPGNGHDDVTHCHQETTTKKDAAALWSSWSAAHIQRIPVKGKPMNKNLKVIGTCAKAIVTRNLEGKLNGTLSRDVSSKFGTYCRKYDVEGILLDSGDFILNFSGAVGDFSPQYTGVCCGINVAIISIIMMSFHLFASCI